MMIKKKMYVAVNLLMVGSCGMYAEPVAKAETKEATKAVAKDAKKEVATSIDISQFSSTGDLKIRYIDVYGAMGSSEEGRKVQQEVEQKRQELAHKLKSEEENFKKAFTDFQSKGSALNQEARDKEQQKLVKMEKELKSQAEEVEQEFQVFSKRATEKLARQVEKAVTEYALKESLDAVVDRTTGQAVFVSKKADCTMQTMDIMNSNFKVAQDTAKSESTKKDTVVA